MATSYDACLLRERLREAFGDDSQETIAGKLNMSQGNVSKMLSGSHFPTIDTIYIVSKEYNVSSDWLLGLSDKREEDIFEEKGSYTSAVNAMMEMIKYSSITIRTTGDYPTFKLEDPLINMLINKGQTLYKTDYEMYEDWVKNKVSLFKDCELLYASSWQSNDMGWVIGEAGNKEANWLQAWEMAKKEEMDFAEMAGDNVGFFDS